MGVTAWSHHLSVCHVLSVVFFFFFCFSLFFMVLKLETILLIRLSNNNNTCYFIPWRFLSRVFPLWLGLSRKINRLSFRGLLEIFESLHKLKVTMNGLSATVRDISSKFYLQMVCQPRCIIPKHIF